MLTRSPLLFLSIIVCSALALAGLPRAQPSPGSGDPALAGDPVPDTTEAWRYYPLAVGNAWEYVTVTPFDDDTLRVEVVADTVALGRRYFFTQEFLLQDGVVRDFGRSRFPFRFDTTTATVYEFAPIAGGDVPVRGPLSCPLDAPFGAVDVECLGSGGGPTVSGGYDGVLVLGSGASADTVRTPIKTFEFFSGLVAEYAAGIGLVYGANEGGGQSLSYYRVGDEERGTPWILPVDGEGRPRAEPAGAPEVWPNPSRGLVTLQHQLPAGARFAEIAVFDALGREVWAGRARVTAEGRLHQRLDLTAFPTGAYALTVAYGDRFTASVTFLLVE